MHLSKIVGMESWITIEASTIQIQSAQLFLSVLIQFLTSYNRDKETIEMQREIKICGFETENYKAVSASLNASKKLRLRADAVQLIFIIGFLLASMRLVDAVGALEECFAEIFYLDARVQRINELRNTPTQTGMEIELKHFDVELRDVEFSYNEETPVISGINLVVKQDQVTAIV